MPEEPVTPPDTAEDSGKFLVRLENFTGPFDLLLQLIGKHKLDVTEVALHQVTDDFIAYIRAMGDDWDLGEASEFLLVAATLLDLKAARLLPAAEVEDEDDLALLEARDLLFARLLQYKAFKEAAAFISDLEGTGAKRYPRAVSMEPRYAEALPDLVLGIGVERLFKLALKQFTPKPGPPQVSIAHIHQVRVSVREHAALLRDRLRRAGTATFTLLVADCESTLEIVARFLALLELYREGLVDFEQPVSLDELTVRWIGGDAPDSDLDIDDYEGTRPDPDAPPPADLDNEEPRTEADDAAVPDLADAPERPEPDVDAVESRVGLERPVADLDEEESGADLDGAAVSDFAGAVERLAPDVVAAGARVGLERPVADLGGEESGADVDGAAVSDLAGILERPAPDFDAAESLVGREGPTTGFDAAESWGGGSAEDGPGTGDVAVSDSGEAGVDPPEDRPEPGGKDDDAAPAALEERS